MQLRALFIALSLCVGNAIAGCTKDDKGIRHCTGLSWTARVWVYVGAAIVFILCNMLVVHLVRRHYRKKKARLPAAPGARPYAPGEYWEGRLGYLPGYKPPEALRPVIATVAVPETRSSMSQVPSRAWTSRPLGQVARTSTRTSEQPPAYETSFTQPRVVLHRSGTDSTLAEPSRPLPSIAFSGPPVPAYYQAGQ